MKRNKKIKYELIAPAGSLEKAKYALNYGADSIYLGIPDFSLRVRINKFNEIGIEEMVDYAHKINKKVYITVNIYAHNKHINSLPKYLKQIEAWKADGIIISDPGIITLAKKYCPLVPIHLSTQANCTNWQAAKFWFDLGVRRIVLGREVTLEEIKEIHKKVPRLELEYFAHGAMCMSYSGRCLLSSFFVGRSANLGDCVQPCRWEYNVKKTKKQENKKTSCHCEEERSDDVAIPVLTNKTQKNCYIKAKGHEDKTMRIEEDNQGSYILNSKDLALVKYLDDLKEAGITSFKIEGRAKSVYYVALVSKIYRQALNLKGTKDKIKRELNKLFKELQTLTHREYTTGFLFGKKTVEQKYDASHKLTNYQFVGEVKKSIKLKTKNKKWQIYIKVHNELFIGDKIEIIQPKGEKVKLKIKKMLNIDNEEIIEAHGGQEKTIIITVNKKIENMSIIRKKIL